MAPALKLEERGEVESYIVLSNSMNCCAKLYIDFYHLYHSYFYAMYNDVLKLNDTKKRVVV